MNTKTVVASQIVVLKNKLNAAIESRASLEDDFKTQSSLLIQFISKLSYVSKGLNLELDNRLAQLRVLFSTSAPFSDIEQKIIHISTLLQRHSVTNEQNITQLHGQFNLAGTKLQKINKLPPNLRRKLRTLLKDTESTKDTLIQYIPLMNQLLSYYDAYLKTKNDTSNENLLTINNTHTLQKNTLIENKLNADLIEKISACLSKLHLPAQHTKKLQLLKNKLLKDASNDAVLEHFIEIFDVIFAELKSERDSATDFLNSLSDTLATVQDAVKKTLSTCQISKKSNTQINVKLQKQIQDMNVSVKDAMSLEKVKVDINSKLQLISATLEQKSTFEQQSQQVLANQLKDMASKVDKLEKQSVSFEKKLAEQQRKSMQDALTKLNNRAAFDDYFSKAMVRFHHNPYELALVVADIDNFKKINDTYGHTAGDKTLQVIANTIQKKVGNDVFVARYGGEEFVLIYDNKNKHVLIKELNALNQNIAKLPFKFKDNKVSITLSMGVTHILPSDNIHMAFERADEGMYKAKALGKNQVVYL